MIVMKFGGSALNNADAIKHVVEIIRQHREENPLVVVSAQGKTTRHLLEMARATVSGGLESGIKELESIRSEFRQICRQLGLGEEHQKVQIYFAELEEQLSLLATRENLTPFFQDRILAYGELITAVILTELLNSNDIPAVLLDARACMITDDHFTQAHPILDDCHAQVLKYVMPHLHGDNVPVIQGYIGSTRAGETTTLGFEGSDFSAVVFGSIIGAHEIQLWKDVTGIFSSDPQLVTEAYPIPQITYDEAASLSATGSKVIHQATIEPARLTGKSITIKSYRQPDQQGTRIVSEIPDVDRRLVAIAFRQNVVQLSIRANPKTAPLEFLSDAFRLLGSKEISPILIKGSNRNLTLILDINEKLEDLITEIKKFAEVETQRNLATLSFIGHYIGSNIRLLEEIEGIIRQLQPEIPFSMVADHHLTFLVKKADVLNQVRKLHRRYVLHPGGENG